MELPDGIETDIINYLCLELGEDPHSDAALKVNDLVYEGVNDVDGIRAHCWGFPTMHEDMWVTVVVEDGSISFGMAQKPKDKKGDPYATLFLNVSGKKPQKHRVKLMQHDDMQLATTPEPSVRFGLGNDGCIEVYSEVSFLTRPPLVALSINCGNQRQYIKARAGIAMSFQVDEETTVYLSIGDLD